MIKSKICFVAEGIIRDAATNGISAFNILEALIGEGFPLFIQKMNLFTLWERELNDPKKYDLVIEVKLDRKVLHSIKLQIDFEEKPRNRTFVSFNGILVPHPGNLNFIIRINKKIKASYKVIVNAQPTKIKLQN